MYKKKNNIYLQINIKFICNDIEIIKMPFHHSIFILLL